MKGDPALAGPTGGFDGTLNVVGSMVDQQRRRELLSQYSAGTVAATDLRRQLDDASYGDVLRMLADEGLPLPRAPTEGREETIARARAWLFPKQGNG